MNVKWLRRIKVTAEPTMTKDETSKYSDLQPDGRSLLFTFPMEVKSVITSPSGDAEDAGRRAVSDLRRRVVGLRPHSPRRSVGGRRQDAGRKRRSTGRCCRRRLTRFRMPWRWDGSPSVLQSRAIDETGAVQPTRAALMAARGARYRYHYNAIQSWNVAAAGEVSNVYA